MTNIVAISGNICVGKSTLAKSMHDNAPWVVLEEPSNDNRYLDQLRADPATWAFHTQIDFLALRTEEFLKMSRSAPSGQTVVSDRTIDEDFGVFARLQTELGYITETEAHTLGDLFDCLAELVPRPCAVVYLHSPVEVLLSRALARSPKDKLVSEQELIALNVAYDQWIDNLEVPVLSIDTSLVDARSTGILGDVIAFVEDAVGGLVGR